MPAFRLSATRIVGALVAVSLVLTGQPLSAQTTTRQEITPEMTRKLPVVKYTPPVDPLTVEGYILPPDPIARLVTAPRESNISYTTAGPGAARKYFLKNMSDGLPTLQQLGKAHYNLGGFQVDYPGNRARAMTTRSGVGFELYEWATGKTVKIAMPAGARSGTATFSPDGTMLAYIAEFPTSTQIYIADPATGVSKPLVMNMLATNVQNFEWTADNKSIVAVTVPDGRGPEPKDNVIAMEPVVRLNEGNKLHTSVYPDLVESPHEKALVEYYSTGQLAIIDLKTKLVKKIGAPGMIQRLDASPDAKFFRVTYLDKPFSYVLPVSSFGNTEVLIDQTGKVLHTMSTRPLRENQDTARTDTTAAGGRGAAPAAGRGGRGGTAGGAAAVDTARRALNWHPFDAAMMYIQRALLPAGQKADSATVAALHDRVIEWLPPFDTTAASRKVLYESEGTINSVQYSDNGRIMFVGGTGTGGTYEKAIYLDEGNKEYTVIAGTGGARGGAPGGRGAAGGGAAGGRGGRGGAGGGGGATALVTKAGSRGMPVVMISSDGKYVFQTGPAGAGGAGGRGGAAAPAADTTTGPARPPYVDRIEIKTGTKDRIYQSTSKVSETLGAALDDDYSKLIVNRESATVVGQSFLIDTKTKEEKQLTSNKDLFPEITATIKKTVIAKRADGHTFRIKVTLPPDWKPGTRLPALFWFYPAEFESQEAYDRPAAGGAAGGANRFTTYGPRSLAFITTVGYALIEPDTPIFSQNGQPPNDHYVDDLRDDLTATIDALDSLGYIDRQKLAIGGHSYGAFSTANAMVHTPFFKAGIAGDGDYNRTLTPTGFQNERRDLWAGREVYLNMSPFLYADHLNGALLMYHSLEDQNVGTAPINSIRMYHALQSLGKTTALFMYPYEDHGPVAKETDLDQWARWVAWLDKYVKNPNPAAKAAPVVAAPGSPGNR